MSNQATAEVVKGRIDTLDATRNAKDRPKALESLADSLPPEMQGFAKRLREAAQLFRRDPFSAIGNQTTLNVRERWVSAYKTLTTLRASKEGDPLTVPANVSYPLEGNHAPGDPRERNTTRLYGRDPSYPMHPAESRAKSGHPIENIR